MLVVFSPIFVAGTKMISVCNFVAPLTFYNNMDKKGNLGDM